MSVIVTNFKSNTKFFMDKLFAKPFGLNVTENETILTVSLDTNKKAVTFTVTGPGTFGDVSKAIVGKDSRDRTEELARLLTFYNVASLALRYEPVETLETVIMQLMDGIITGEYDTVPVIDQDLICSLSDSDLIMGYNPVKVSHYVTDGVQCRRGYLSQVILELGEPRGLQIPYSYLVLIAGNKVAFNQSFTYDHNLLHRDEDNHLLQPIATGEIEYVGNGYANITTRNADHCVVESEESKCEYDLLGIRPL